MLVDGDHEASLARVVREPTKNERQAMAAANDRLHAASRFDPIAIRLALRQIRVECERARIARFPGRHRSSTSPHPQRTSAGTAQLLSVEKSSPVDADALALLRAIKAWSFASPHQSITPFTAGRFVSTRVRSGSAASSDAGTSDRAATRRSG
jgi:hypothetical protein